VAVLGREGADRQGDDREIWVTVHGSGDGAARVSDGIFWIFGKMKIELVYWGCDGLRSCCFVSYSASGGRGVVATASIVIFGFLWGDSGH
jgi:hypothetical protein